jgi:hypothetical protein
MQRDPAGHYAVLDVDPAAPAAAVTASYRQQAKLLHPDMPGTGNAEAFMRLQAAYQILGDPERRRAYDQGAGNREAAAKRPAWRQEATELAFTPAFSWRPPRFVGIALGVVTLLAVAQVAIILLRPAPTPAARAPMVEASAPAAPARLQPIPPLSRSAGDHFVTPGTGPAVLWQRAPERPGYVPAGHLEAFATVALLRRVPKDGQADGQTDERAEIRTAAGQVGYVETARLLAGDARAARRAACLHHAGPPLRGGQSLVHRGSGPVRVSVENREDRPALFKLRDGQDIAAAALYLAPRSSATIADLPVGTYRAEFAVGDLWSHACGMFMAGMRAQRFPAAQEISGAMRFILPPPDIQALDITDEAFSRE